MHDLISRRQAIDALCKSECGCGNAECRHKDGTDFCVTCDNVKIIKSLPSIQPEQRWIPCSERLPEDEYVLISKKPSEISGDKWCVAIAIRTADPRSRKIQWRDSGFGIIPDDKVLAWMPLPEPARLEND